MKVWDKIMFQEIWKERQEKWEIIEVTDASISIKKENWEILVVPNENVEQRQWVQIESWDTITFQFWIDSNNIVHWKFLWIEKWNVVIDDWVWLKFYQANLVQIQKVKKRTF